MAEWITAAEYARRLDLEPPTVRAAMKSGRIPFKKNTADKKLINWDEEKDSFKNNTNPHKQFNSLGSEGNAQSKNIPAFADSRAIREAYNAKIAKLDFETKLGQYVELEKIRSINFQIARRVRDSVLRVPQVIAPELASMTDSFAIEQKLTAAIHAALEEAAK